MCLPTSALPVNAILSNVGWATRGAPAPGPQAGDDVDHARGQAARLEELGQREQRERRLLRGLDDHRAARRERGRDLPRRHQQGIVPGDDLAGHAYRLAHREGDRVGGDLQHLAVDLRSEPGVVLVAGRSIVHVVLGLDDRLAGIDRFDLGELVLAGPDSLGKTKEYAATLLGGDGSPPFIEGARGRLHGAVDIRRPARRAGRDHTLGRWVVHVEGLAALRVYEFSVDVHLVGGCFGFAGLVPCRSGARHALPSSIWGVSQSIIEGGKAERRKDGKGKVYLSPSAIPPFRPSSLRRYCFSAAQRSDPRKLTPGRVIAHVPGHAFSCKPLHERIGVELLG